MQTIQQHITGLTTAKDAYAQMYQAAERLGKIEPADISHMMAAETSRRKYDAIGRAIAALQDAL